MKKSFFVPFLVCIFFAFYFFTSIVAKEKKFSGYIPKNQTPKIEWIQSFGDWAPRATIQTVINGHDTISAELEIAGTWPGRNLVVFKGSYPPSVDQEVYVRGRIDKSNKYWIDEAQLYYFKK